MERFILSDTYKYTQWHKKVLRKKQTKKKRITQTEMWDLSVYHRSLLVW